MLIRIQFLDSRQGDVGKLLHAKGFLCLLERGAHCYLEAGCLQSIDNLKSNAIIVFHPGELFAYRVRFSSANVLTNPCLV